MIRLLPLIAVAVAFFFRTVNLDELGPLPNFPKETELLFWILAFMTAVHIAPTPSTAWGWTKTGFFLTCSGWLIVVGVVPYHMNGFLKWLIVSVAIIGFVVVRRPWQHNR